MMTTYYPFSLSLPRWRSMLCALVVLSFPSYPGWKNPLNVVRRQFNTRRLLTGIMAGRLWIRVSASGVVGCRVTGGGRYRGVVALRPAGVPEGFAVSNGRIEATKWISPAKLPGVLTPFW